MTAHITRARLVPVALAAVLVLGACGSEETAGDRAPSPSTTVEPGDGSGGGLRAPTPIDVAGTGATSAAGVAADSDRVAAESADMSILPYRISEYVLADGFPDLPTDDTGYLFEIGKTVDAEQVAALAAAFGVQGEPTRLDDGYTGAWRVGPDDGSAPSLWVYEDAQLSWSYSSAWATQGEAVACSVSVDADGKEVEVCDEPEPPEGVPTADEAEARARELLVAVGEDPAAYEFETYADEWFASTTASQRLDDRFAGRRWDFGFGAEGVLQYASGALATPERVGPYPLIDLDTALARLNEMQFGVMGGGIATDLVRQDVATSAESEVAEGGGVDGGAPAGDDPMPVEPIPDAEPVVVTLVEVEADVWWAWDTEGSAWLLPAFRFVDTEGGWHTVPAVTDEFLNIVEPTPEPMPEPEPAPATEPTVVEATPEPGTVPESGSETEPGESPATVPGEAPAVPEELRALTGIGLEEFTARAAELRYDTRVVRRDGEDLAVTADFSETRVNVAVEAEIVVDVLSIG